MRVLIAEDDRYTRAGLVELLEQEGYEVFTASNGDAAVREFLTHRPDFVCLDIMMPCQSGYEACKKIRHESADVPIMFISAKAEEIDRLVGFEVGADDFIIKPFSTREVIARVRAISRRCKQSQANSSDFELGDLVVMSSQLRAKRGEECIELSLRDIKILRLLYQNQGKVLDRDYLFRHVWGEHRLLNSRTLDQHISQLRKRIEIDVKDPQIIQTVHGVGYRFG
jgi:two-component system, OmpR family, alkaline phosphatase synthesis response regulator PhoP